VREAGRFQQHRDARCQTFFYLQGKAPKEIHAILTETLICFLPGRAKDLSAPYWMNVRMIRRVVLTLKQLLKRFYTNFIDDYLTRGNEPEFSSMEYQVRN